MTMVNGVGNPRLEVKKKNGTTVTIDLPMPEMHGNRENPKEVVVLHDAFDGEEISDSMGFKPEFTLDYSTALDGLDLLSLRHLLETAAEITLTPHVDLPGRKFTVRLIEFGEISRFGATEAHSGVKMKFRSTVLIDAMPFPQVAWTGKTWGDLTAVAWSDLTAVVWHFFR